MRVAYVVNLKMSDVSGVSKKILQQVLVWRSLGVDARLFSMEHPSDIDVGSEKQITAASRWSNEIFKRFFVIKPLINEINSYSPDLVYMRYAVWNPTYDIILKKYRTIVEIQTNDIEEFRLLRFHKLKWAVGYPYFICLRDRFLSKAYAFISVTEELCKIESYKKYNKPIYCIPNGIDLGRTDIIKNIDLVSDNRVRLFFIGSEGCPWHGIDLIESLADRLPEYEFHIVGINRRNRTPSNIKYHGIMPLERYRQILSGCHICIGTLAAFRQKMYEACPLKVREYLAGGFPVILGYKDTSFLKGEFNFILTENFEKGVSDHIVERIKEFVQNNKNKVVDRNSIRHIDIAQLERERIGVFKSIIRS